MLQPRFPCNYIPSRKGEASMIGEKVMTTMETNIILLRKVPDDLQDEIQSFLLSKLNLSKSLKPLSKQEIYDILEESSQQAKDGRHRSAKESLDELGKKYGII